MRGHRASRVSQDITPGFSMSWCHGVAVGRSERRILNDRTRYRMQVLEGRKGAGVAGMQVALLRGINVGTAKRVAMADLRALVEGLGYGDVRTLLNSGNVVFSVPRTAKGDPAARIEKALAAKLGVSSRILVLRDPGLAALGEE